MIHIFGSRQRAAAFMLVGATAGCSIDAIGVFEGGSGGTDATGSTGATTTGASAGSTAASGDGGGGGTTGAGGDGGVGTTTGATTTATTSTGTTCASDKYYLHVDPAGGADAVQVTPNTSQELGDDVSNWTLAGRIRRTGSVGTVFYRFDANASLKLELVAGALVASAKDSSAGCQTSATTIAANSWSTIAMGYSSNNLVLRVWNANGTEVSPDAISGTCPSAIKLSDTAPLEIGRGFLGDLDEIYYSTSPPSDFDPAMTPPIGNLSLHMTFDGMDPLANSASGAPVFAFGTIGAPQYLCQIP
jgi:hypothetical protein